MGTIFLVIGREKRAPHWGVQSRFRILSVCRMSVVCQINCVGGIDYMRADSALKGQGVNGEW